MAAVRRTALIVEDDTDVARLLQFILQREGFDATLLRDGREAAARIDAGPVPHLVLMDVMLPHATGHELLARIRSHEAWKAVPVIMLTAKSQETDIVKAFDHGASDYLAKPFQPAELKARIRRLVPPA